MCYQQFGAIYQNRITFLEHYLYNRIINRDCDGIYLMQNACFYSQKGYTQHYQGIISVRNIVLHIVKFGKMISRAEIEYLKKVNGIRKKMGLDIDIDQCNQHTFLLAISNAKKKKKKADK